jgi:mono/diheme cytochrome c family protein
MGLKNSRIGWAVYVVAALLIVVLVIFLVEMFSFNQGAVGIEPVSATAYRDRVAALLANADPTNAESAIQTYGCPACHRAGAANGIAPLWVDIAYRAATRRPPMPAAAYLYESIVHPEAYVVEGYPNSMVPNFGSRISDQELGDIIAYLLTPDAR